MWGNCVREKAIRGMGRVKKAMGGMWGVEESTRGNCRVEEAMREKCVWGRDSFVGKVVGK